MACLWLFEHQFRAWATQKGDRGRPVRYFPILFPPPLIVNSSVPSLSTLPSSWPPRLLINACVSFPLRLL
jgi:hypothetical protein